MRWARRRDRGRRTRRALPRPPLSLPTQAGRERRGSEDGACPGRDPDKSGRFSL